MHSTPISIATPKLANSACISCASPSSAICTEGGRFWNTGRARASAFTSPSERPDSSTSSVTLRLRFRRSIWAGPLSTVMSATFASSTGPCAPGTVRRPRASRSARTASGSLTRIGTWRSDRFILASAWS